MVKMFLALRRQTIKASHKAIERIQPMIAKASKAPKLPKPSFFQQLKTEERQHFGNHQKRVRYPYEKNYSMALRSNIPRDLLVAKQSDPAALLDASREEVKEHASRKVDLFFLTMIAYYQTKMYPTEGHTVLQHGKGQHVGNRLVTEACHSSITPGLIDAKIFEPRRQGSKKSRSILSDTHFIHNLNATVELPSCVNEFDGILEELCRDKSLGILQEVAGGQLNPIEGLSRFLNLLQITLINLKSEAQKSHQSVFFKHLNLHCGPVVSLSLINLVTQGALDTTYSVPKKAVNMDYVHLMLRISPEELDGCADEEALNKLYLEKIALIHNEILVKDKGLHLVLKEERNVPRI